MLRGLSIAFASAVVSHRAATGVCIPVRFCIKLKINKKKTVDLLICVNRGCSIVLIGNGLQSGSVYQSVRDAAHTVT
jgi:hypothetical protein